MEGELGGRTKRSGVGETVFGMYCTGEECIFNKTLCLGIKLCMHI